MALKVTILSSAWYSVSDSSPAIVRQHEVLGGGLSSVLPGTAFHIRSAA